MRLTEREARVGGDTANTGTGAGEDCAQVEGGGGDSEGFTTECDTKRGIEGARH